MKRDDFFSIGKNAKDDKYGDEDLLTDSFVALLILDQGLAKEWFKYLSGISPSKVEITAQPPFKDYPENYPDVFLESPEANIICEHKVASPLGDRQLERYLNVAECEQRKTGKAHFLAFIARDKVSNVPSDVLSSEKYIKPDDFKHFRWKGLHRLIAQLLDKSKLEKNHPLMLLREQFLMHLVSQKLAPAFVPDKLPLLFSSEKNEDVKEQQRAFGENWCYTDVWFAERGYKCEYGSRVELYALTTAFSEIPSSSEIKHMWLAPNSGKQLPADMPFEGPALRFRVFFKERIPAKIEFMPGSLSIESVGGMTAVKNVPHTTPAVDYWLSFKALMNGGDLPDKLRDVAQEIYKKAILPYFGKA